MKVIAEIKKKLYCQKVGHMQQQIDYICDDSSCNINRLCCYLCRQQYHKTHSMKNIKIVVGKIMDIEKQCQKQLEISASFDTKVNQIKNILYQIKQLLYDYQNIFILFNKYVEIKKNKAINILEFYKYLSYLCNFNIKEFQQKIQQFFCQNFIYFEIQKNQKDQDCNVYHNALKQIHQEFKSIVKTLKKLQKQNKIDDFQVLTLFPIEQANKFMVFRPHFSQQYKGTNMKITQNTAQMMTSNSQRVLALQPSLQVGFRIKQWRIKIIKLNSWIGLGACHINKLKQSNWYFNYNATKHGSYFISSNGYSWSSYKPQYNSKFETFTFGTGDTIIIQFKMHEKKLYYNKQNTQENYQIDVEINQDPLHPAVNLTGVGDSVEIIY